MKLNNIDFDVLSNDDLKKLLLNIIYIKILKLKIEKI